MTNVDKDDNEDEETDVEEDDDDDENNLNVDFGGYKCECGGYLQILKYIKSIKGGFGEYAERTNSKDINKISSCCFNFDRVLDENQDGE